MNMRERLAKILSDADGMHPDAVSNDEDELPVWTTYLGTVDTVLDALMEPTEGMVEVLDDYAGTIAPEFAYIAAIQAAKDGK